MCSFSGTRCVTGILVTLDALSTERLFGERFAWGVLAEGPFVSAPGPDEENDGTNDNDDDPVADFAGGAGTLDQNVYKAEDGQQRRDGIKPHSERAGKIRTGGTEP